MHFVVLPPDWAFCPVQCVVGSRSRVCGTRPGLLSILCRLISGDIQDTRPITVPMRDGVTFLLCE